MRDLEMHITHRMFQTYWTEAQTYSETNGSGARCSSVVRAFAHGAISHRIDPTWWTH